MRLQFVGNRWCGAVLVALLSCGSAPAWAATITVVNTKDQGRGSLRQAIMGARAGDTIDFRLNLPNIIVLTSGPLIVSTTLRISGPVGGHLTISGNNTSRVLMVSAPVWTRLQGVEISNLTIRDGRTTAGIPGAPGTSTGCYGGTGGSGSPGDHGGGIYNTSSLTLIDVTVTGNQTGDGGAGGPGGNGALCDSGGVDPGYFSFGGPGGRGSTGGHGGGIYNAGRLTLINVTVSGNHTGGGGSGGGGGGGGVTAADIFGVGSGGFGGNGGYGGGIYNAGRLTLTNTTISGNETGDGGNGGDSTLSFPPDYPSSGGGGGAGGDGGGIYNAGTLTLTNTTMSSHATGNGGTGGISDLYFGGDGFYGAGGGIFNAAPGTVTLSNSIIADSKGENCAGSAIDASPGDNISSDTSCNLTGPNNRNNTSPQLGPLQANGGPTFTHAPMFGGPAMDEVHKTCPLPWTDQRGVQRPVGPRCDIGAVELRKRAAP